MMLTPKYLKAYSKIFKAKKVLLACHVKPDGDALAAMCAMIELMDYLGKPFVAFCRDVPPRQYAFLPHLDRIASGREGWDFADFDVVVILDCGQLARSGLENEVMSRGQGQYVIELDHHPKMQDYADLEIRNDKASSTSEIVHDLLRANMVKFNKNFANCVLTGILFDTGNLVFESTSDKTIKIASDMLLYGARFPLVSDGLSRNKTVGGMKVWGRVMDRLRVNPRWGVAVTALMLKDIEGQDVSDEELEGIANFLATLNDASVLLFLRELPGNKVKGSLRASDPRRDVSLIASQLGGGGHRPAAAFVTEGRIEETATGWKIV